LLIKALILVRFQFIDPNLAEPWNEWWVRLEAQKNINEQLEQQRKWLELELEHSKQRTAAGSLPEAMNFDLDSLSEVFGYLLFIIMVDAYHKNTRKIFLKQLILDH